MEAVYRRINGEITRLSNRYTRGEIWGFWRDGKNRVPSKATTIGVVRSKCSEETALVLAALYLRRIDPDPLTMTYKDGYFLAFVENGSNRDYWVRLIRAYDSVGVDEGGRLFAQPGNFDIDVVGLVECLKGCSRTFRALGNMELVNEIDGILKEDYLGPPR